MKILIIGASGLVGGACYNFFYSKYGNSVKGTYRNYISLNRKFEYFDPAQNTSTEILLQNWDVIIHTAALTNVDMCEKEIEISYKETVLSTAIIINKLKLSNPDAIIIYISTDYVFDGRGGPYKEDSIPNPINIYGKHKLESEKMILNNFHNSAIVRVTNVYGEEDRNKNFIARKIMQIKEGGSFEIKASTDQFATPVYAYDIARVIDVIIEKKLVGIFHASGSDYFNRFQLVSKVLEYFPRHNVNAIPLETSILKQDAPRPLLGGLINHRLYKASSEFIFMNIDSYLKKIIKNEV